MCARVCVCEKESYFAEVWAVVSVSMRSYECWELGVRLCGNSVLPEQPPFFLYVGSCFTYKTKLFSIPVLAVDALLPSRAEEALPKMCSTC